MNALQLHARVQVLPAAGSEQTVKTAPQPSIPLFSSENACLIPPINVWSAGTFQNFPSVEVFLS